MEQKHVHSGIRLTATQRAKLVRLAAELHTSKNQVIGLLLDSAVVQAPSAHVALKASRQDGTNIPATK